MGKCSIQSLCFTPFCYGIVTTMYMYMYMYAVCMHVHVHVHTVRVYDIQCQTGCFIII